MTRQSAKICETCQFVSQDDQQDHSCLDYLIKRNNELTFERAQLYEVLDRLKSILNQSVAIYLRDAKPPKDPVEFVAFVEAIGKEITPWQ